MMELRKVSRNHETKKPNCKAILASAVLVAGIMGCSVVTPKKTATVCSSQGMVMWNRQMEENPDMLTPEQKEFLLRNDYVHMRCVTVEVK